ncbi:hypothetical protein B1H18_12250 [Streptomyces tsukubensis]|uniref:Uncharacterized protein n=1 Tax=Streptomyces tsukubensis TaxID=83656 RepID=A0A1V4AB29_9ACTN|nr:hypothetical protein B1H18_12250 [Streptomyces tsukubensis]
MLGPAVSVLAVLVLALGWFGLWRSVVVRTWLGFLVAGQHRHAVGLFSYSRGAGYTDAFHRKQGPLAAMTPPRFGYGGPHRRDGRPVEGRRHRPA